MHPRGQSIHNLYCEESPIQYHGRSKHIDIKYHFTRDQVISGNIELNYCKSEDMVADLFTKPLSGPQFKRLRELLGLTAIEEEC